MTSKLRTLVDYFEDALTKTSTLYAMKEEVFHQKAETYSQQKAEERAGGRFLGNVGHRSQ